MKSTNFPYALLRKSENSFSITTDCAHSTASTNSQNYKKFQLLETFSLTTMNSSSLNSVVFCMRWTCATTTWARMSILKNFYSSSWIRGHKEEPQSKSMVNGLTTRLALRPRPTRPGRTAPHSCQPKVRLQLLS